MWTRNTDTGKWFKQTDSLSKDNYDDLKQDLQKVKLYSKCLSGSTYLPINDLSNIYSPLSIDKIGFYVNESPLYSLNFPPLGPQVPLNTTNSDEFYNKYLKENAFTLKNFFTPEKLIADQLENYYEVDVATTDSIITIGVSTPNLTIDGIRLLEGHRVLVKDQITEVELTVGTDLENYFTNIEQVSSYTEIADNVTSKTYIFHNNQNGIYKYTNNTLVREDDLETYDVSYKYSVNVKLGDTNREKQYHLSRLKGGYYPLISENQNIEFSEKTNWILRNRVDYNNQFDLNLHEILYHATQSFFDTELGRTFSIPERVLTVGEFGTILNNQGQISSSATFSTTSYIYNKWKVTLKSISQTEKYYWICGHEGTLLRVDKVTLEVMKIDLGEVNNLLSISFYGNLNGMVVGEYNSIYYTVNGGLNWIKIDFPSFDIFSYKKVIHFDLTTAYVLGNNGLFLEMIYSFGEWIATKRKISEFKTPDDEYIMVDDINDGEKVRIVTSQPATYSFNDQSQDFFDTLVYNTSINSNNQIQIYLTSPYFGTGVELNLKFRISLKIEGDQSGVIYQSSSYTYTLPSPVPGTASWDLYQDSTTDKDRVFIYNLPLDNIGDILEQRLSISTNVLYNYDGATFTGGWYQSGLPANWEYDLTNGDFICLVGNNENFILYDKNSSLTSPNQFIYFHFTQSVSDLTSVAKSKTSGDVLIGGDKVYKVNLGDVLDVTNSTNAVNSSATSWGDFFVNDIQTNQDNIFISGNGSLSKKGNYSSTNYDDLDPSFRSKLKSKLLFLDYDMASKLNFFTDLGEYRLPQSVTFSFDLTAGTFSLQSISGEFSYLDYFKDSEKTFEYFTSIQESNVVKISTTFSYSPTLATFSFVGSQISNSLSEILPMATNINLEGSSRFISITPPLTTNFTTTSKILLYKYLMIIVGMENVSVGDVLKINSNVVETTVVVNKIRSVGYTQQGGQFITPAINYVYCYTEFNDNIIRNLKSSTSQMTIVNLNKYRDFNDMISKFDSHPISIAYKLEKSENTVIVSPRFNNKTAYYNLQSTITLGTQSKDSVYDDNFLDFGYSPTYNIEDYLTNVDGGVFTSGMKFSILPEYYNLPGNQGNSATSSNIYIDPSIGNLTSPTYSYYRSGTNTIIFGDNYKFHWESLLIHTFVDLILTDTNNTVYSLEKFLITKKYYDSSTGGWVMEFHKKIDIPSGATIQYFTILSRNTLSQMSSDLQILNNIQRTQITKNIQSNYTFNNLENELKYKFPTDSYFKALASDWRIQKYLSGIIYTDYDYNISFNVFQVGEKKSYNITGTVPQDSAGFTNRLRVDLDSSHEIEIGDLVYLQFTGGTQSSEYLNTDYVGYHRVVDKYSISGYGWVVLNIPYGVASLVQDVGILSTHKVDPFFNYQPIDLFRLGSDKRITRSVEIRPENYEFEGSTWSLVNLDLNRFKLRFVDGLYLEEVSRNYHWLLEAEVSNAVIGRNNSGLVWYSGDWLCGRWFGGTWISGRWVSGDWYGGVWNSYKTVDRFINILVDTSNVDFRSSRWFGGRWFDGTWNGGTWFNGRRYAGTWVDGIWFGGIWNDGLWMNGRFEGGVWVIGKWESGILNSNSKPTYWLDGEFNTGDFENGIWYNGKFGNDQQILARFGTKSTNTRPSIWHGGVWLNGEFHSFLNLNTQTGLPDVSEVHKYSIWRTGRWLGGSFWGGVAYNISFQGGTWHGGVLEEIQVIGVNAIEPATQSTNSIVLNGIFRFNIGDEIWIIDDERNTVYSPLGSNDVPRNYRINFVQEDETLDRTTIKLNYNLSTLGVDPTYASQSLVGYETGLRVVSYFKDSTWQSGIWTNGIFENGNMNSVIWYNGVFLSGNWGN